MSKYQNSIGTFAAGALAVSAITVMGAATPAASRPSFDGLWSVVIVTEKGSCDRAYRYPVRISRGSVLNAGSSIVSISGRVTGNGAIKVTVSRNGQSASGTGRLFGKTGSGSWQGGECAGIWQAERRGA